MSSTLTQPQNPACPKCGAKYVAKKGKRRNRHRTLQIYQCAECEHKFTTAAGRNKTYPLKVILDAISTFNLGHSRTEAQRILRERSRLDIPERTISLWLNAYRPLATYARLRNAGKKLFRPKSVVQSITLHHQQVYQFQLHRAKLQLLFENPRNRHLAPARGHLESIGEDFPHRTFETTEHRSSKFPTSVAIPITRKENYATRLAALVLPAATANKKRHETLQRFMLANDSATVAVEIPVYLTKEDIAYYREGRHTARYGIRNFRVITMTPTRQRAINLCEKLQRAGLASKRFWFTDLAPVLPDEPVGILEKVFFTPKDSTREM